MGGGSTTVLGPKKLGTSLDVVTGVLRSPDWVSQGDGSSTGMQVDAGIGLPPLLTLVPVLYKQVSKLKTLKWWAAAAAALSVKRKAEEWWWWWWCWLGSVSKVSMIILPLFDWFSATTGSFFLISNSQGERRAASRTARTWLVCRCVFYERTFSHRFISGTGRCDVLLLVLWMKSVFHIRKSRARGWPIAERGSVIAPPKSSPHYSVSVTLLWRNTGA